jgi:superfamily II DNA or RNA helicase
MPPQRQAAANPPLTIMQLQLFDTLTEEVQSTGGIRPRDYQQRAIDNTFTLFAQGVPGVLIRQPTGTGKTVVATLIADRWLRRSNRHRVMVLAHEKQLVNQFADEIEDILGDRPAIEMAEEKVTGRPPRITVASRASLYEREEETGDGGTTTVSRLDKFDPVAYDFLVICDEAHHYLYSLPSCQHVLRHFDRGAHNRRLGLTATPMRGDERTLSRVFPRVAADYRLFDLDGGPCAVKDGWAVPYDQRFIMVEGVDFQLLGRDKETGKALADFDPAELEVVLTERRALMSMCDPMLDLVAQRRTIVFCATVAMTKKVAGYLNAERIVRAREGRTVHGEAEALDGTAPDWKRSAVYSRHQRGEIQFLCVCGLCREGYNDPSAGAIAVFRPTKSRPLAEQMKGRGCRPLRGLVDGLPTAEARRAAIASSEKPNALIIDLVGITGMADMASTAHILAHGKPDEVIQRANENMPKDGSSVDMAEEIRKAERQVEEEKEAARKARREREEREAEEALRKAALRGEVRYTAQEVAQGKGTMIHQPQRGQRLRWGRYKGWLVRNAATPCSETRGI